MTVTLGDQVEALRRQRDRRLLAPGDYQARLGQIGPLAAGLARQADREDRDALHRRADGIEETLAGAIAIVRAGARR